MMYFLYYQNEGKYVKRRGGVFAPFPAWGTGNVSLFSPCPSLYFILSY
jgi:hypothetical protein